MKVIIIEDEILAADKLERLIPTAVKLQTK